VTGRSISEPDTCLWCKYPFSVSRYYLCSLCWNGEEGNMVMTTCCPLLKLRNCTEFKS